MSDFHHEPGDRSAGGIDNACNQRTGEREANGSIELRGRCGRGNSCHALTCTALTQDDGEIVSGASDMDGDGQPNTVESYPDDGAGEVHINGGWTFGGFEGGFDGESGLGGGGVQQISGGGMQTTSIPKIRLRGRNPGDRFGESVAILNDINGNGALDLFIGAPGVDSDRGEAYVFYGPFEIPPGQTELLLEADDADVILTSFFDDDEGFGRRVAPLHDLDGDSKPELRVQSLYTHSDGEKYLITQVYSSDGSSLFAIIANPCNVNTWALMEGDALYDQAVTNDDFQRVASNYGEVGEKLTRFDGDLNGDGMVDEVDLDLVLDNFNTFGMLVESGWDAPVEPEIGAGELPVLNLDESAWYAVPDAHPIVVPVGPGHGFTPIRFGNFICAGPECGPSEDCGDPPGCEFFDPCDPECGTDEFDEPYGTCHSACISRFCHAECCESDETCDQSVESFGACHPGCQTRYCQAGCCEDDPNCDQEEEEFGKCHVACANRYCYAECCVNDPDCDQQKEGYGSSHPLCRQGRYICGVWLDVRLRS